MSSAAGGSTKLKATSSPQQAKTGAKKQSVKGESYSCKANLSV
jgi:hypothetical protein